MNAQYRDERFRELDMMCQAGLEDAIGVTMRDIIAEDHIHAWEKSGGSVFRKQKFRCSICGEEKITKIASR